MVLKSKPPLPLLKAPTDTDCKYGIGDIALFSCEQSFNKLDKAIKKWFHDEMLGKTFAAVTSPVFRHAARTQILPMPEREFAEIQTKELNAELEQQVMVVYFSNFLGKQEQYPLMCVYNGPEKKLIVYLPKVMKEARATLPGEHWDKRHNGGLDYLDLEGCLGMLQSRDLISTEPTHVWECQSPNYTKPFVVRRFYAMAVREFEAARMKLGGDKENEDDGDDGQSVDADSMAE